MAAVGESDGSHPAREVTFTVTWSPFTRSAVSNILEALLCTGPPFTKNS